MRLNEGWSAKVGRAVLSYNQQLLLGNAEGVKFTGGQPSGMPQYAAPPEDNILNYKTMQFIGLNKTWTSDNWSGNNVLSFLFTNSGYQYTAGGAASNMQTTGIYGWFPMGRPDDGSERLLPVRGLLYDASASLSATPESRIFDQ